MSLPRGLTTLAKQYGVQLEYTDSTGQHREASQEGALAALHALGCPAESAADISGALKAFDAQCASRLLDPVIVAWNGRATTARITAPRGQLPSRVAYELYLEDGDVRAGELSVERRKSVGGLVQASVKIPGHLPVGYHELALETKSGRAHALIISAPRTAYAPHATERQRDWGAFLPLYALRGESDFGIGDFSGLAELARWTGNLGGRYVGTLPLLAAFLDHSFEPSPYAPVSRLFWNELFLDLRSALDVVPCSGAHAIADAPGFQRAMAELNAAEHVDYREAARSRRRVLEPLAACFFDSDGRNHKNFREFLEIAPRAEDYARFRAVGEREQRGWHGWPARLAYGDITEGDYDAAHADYHLFAQYLCHQQLSRLARGDGAELYLDLPIGVHSESYDVWRERDLFARGFSAGAPPDPFFTLGQDWGFPPLHPHGLREDGYKYLRDALATHFRYAGAVRLDHVMALHRLFWVPHGTDARDGIYVRYPADELYAILCLESNRHRALVIGEDLGTVPPEVRERMKEHRLLRMYVVQFEAHGETPDPLGQVPAIAVASLNTHDMPPFAAYRQAFDADLRADLGLISADEVSTARAMREQLIQALLDQMKRAGFLHDPASPNELRDALLAYLAASDAWLLLVNLEDLWDEEKPQNVPGTSFEKPNWQRRARLTLEQIVDSPNVNAALRHLNRIRSEA